MEDALLAARAGADAIGLIFHPPAKRNVSIERAEEIVRVLPPFITPVGLFVDASLERIREVALRVGLRHVQLHGNEPAEMVAKLREFTVLKAVRVKAETFGAELESWRGQIRKLRLEHLQGLVLETAGSSGGSGVANDWQTVNRHRQRGDLIGLPHLIAAGGLTPDTVAQVVRDLHPWAVDVSSGVEEQLGRKSAQKVEAFVQAVRSTGM